MPASTAAKRWFWLAVGWCALALGAIGVVLPLLPTTPFVILAAFAFSNSSPRLKAWLENNNTFGPIIADWREHGAIATRYKAIACVMMAGALSLSFLLGAPTWVLVVQGICITCAAAFVLTRPG